MTLSHAAFGILIGLGVVVSLAWCLIHGVGAIALARVPILPPEAAAAPLPSLSIVIAACNEVETLEPGLRSLLAQDYPDLEIVVVDDRSTDGTGEIVDRMTATDPRARAVHVKELPPGWLGKVNALRCGYTATRGDYVLFSDADVHFAPGALKAALALAALERLDHLTLLPGFRGTSLMHRALMQEFVAGYVRRTRGSAGLTGAKASFGFGAFNLVRREAFAATEGFEWFRMEVLDDLALGELMKRNGGRCGFAVAPQALQILWYPSLGEAIRGFGKNAFGGLAAYRTGRLFGMAFGTLLLGIAPFFLLFQGGRRWLWSLPALAVMALLSEAAVARKRFGVPLLPGLLTAAAHVLMAFAMVRSALICRRQGGIVWRGTLYPLAELRAGRRVSFP
jgi:glycosyltransferase involved in cell wall biosynthesis